MEGLAEYLVSVADFPKPGIVFKDIGKLLRHRFPQTIEAMSLLFTEDEWGNIDCIAGIESRGFIFASALAMLRKKGVVLIRKFGKLPNVAAKVEYELEYGSATLEMQAGSGRVLVVDDVLATGGTLSAAGELCEKVGYELAGFAVLLNIRELNNFSWRSFQARSIL